MLKLIVILLIIAVLTASPKNSPTDGLEHIPTGLIDIVTSKFTATKDLARTYRALAKKYPGRYKNIRRRSYAAI